MIYYKKQLKKNKGEGLGFIYAMLKHNLNNKTKTYPNKKRRPVSPLNPNDRFDISDWERENKQKY